MGDFHVKVLSTLYFRVHKQSAKTLLLAIVDPSQCCPPSSWEMWRQIFGNQLLQNGTSRKSGNPEYPISQLTEKILDYVLV